MTDKVKLAQESQEIQAGDNFFQKILRIFLPHTFKADNDKEKLAQETQPNDKAIEKILRDSFCPYTFRFERSDDDAEQETDDDAEQATDDEEVYKPLSEAMTDYLKGILYTTDDIDTTVKPIKPYEAELWDGYTHPYWFHQGFEFDDKPNPDRQIIRSPGMSKLNIH